MESNHNLVKNNKNSAAGDYSELDLTELEEFVGGKSFKEILPPWEVGGGIEIAPAPLPDPIDIGGPPLDEGFGGMITFSTNW